MHAPGPRRGPGDESLSRCYGVVRGDLTNWSAAVLTTGPERPYQVVRNGVIDERGPTTSKAYGWRGNEARIESEPWSSRSDCGREQTSPCEDGELWRRPALRRGSEASTRSVPAPAGAARPLSLLLTLPRDLRSTRVPPQPDRARADRGRRAVRRRPADYPGTIRDRRSLR